MNPSGGFQHTLALGSLLKNIGIKGGNIPLINESLTPVLVVGQVDTLDASPVEARGMAGVHVTPGVNRAGVRLTAVGRALIVQDFYLNVMGMTGFEGRLAVHQALPLSGAVDKMDVGGLASSALVSTEDPVPAILGEISLPADVSWVGQRWFIPAGHSLSIQTDIAHDFGVAFVWRELAAPIGGQ